MAEKALLWTDFECTGLEAWGGDEILEIGVIATTLDLDVIWQGEGLVRASQPALQRLKANEIALKMHQENGLLHELYERAESLLTIEEMDERLTDRLYKECPDVKPGEFLLAGSGTASYDRQFINRFMPRLREALHYSGGVDLGVLRRSIRVLGSAAWVPDVPTSSGAGKAHRALADAEAHLEEGRAFRAFFAQVDEQLHRLAGLDK